jgi:hypothetical protein
MSHTLFLDESGHAGANYLARSQPFHTEGGILLPDDLIPTVRQVIFDALDTRSAPELKAAAMLDRAKGRRRLAEVLTRVLALDGVAVIFAVGERRYCLAGRAVETLLDPDTNPAAAFLPNWSVDHREAAWDVVAALDDAVLEQFADAYEVLDAATMSAAASSLANSLDSVGLRRIASACRAAIANMVEIVRVENLWVRPGVKHRLVSALNLPLCMHATKQADRLVEAVGPAAGLRLVHDQINRFDRLLAPAISTLSNGTGTPLELARNDGSSVRMGLRRLDDFSVEDSRAEPCLQLADIVASSVTRILRDTADGTIEWSADLVAIARATVGLLFEHPYLHGTIMASRPTKDLLTQQLTAAGIFEG